MALSANGDWVTQDVGGLSPISMIVKSGSVVYDTALVSHDTTTGEVKPWDGTDADRLVGWHFGDAVTGNGSGARERARIHKGEFTVRALPVTGLNSTTPSGDYGKPVYASDDGTYTLVATSNREVGRVLADDTGVTAGTNANVLMKDVFGLTS